ncbi:hypothetical protein GALMADRAFT_251524 [Galerina marginata CBS 339.88]|uniref:DUF4139 domain-containing protein n=1 Tax=Galerina marginata (strain CBS 339.88) TaxID=685588 RepID=A0A067SS49_GALM3|nr:hypothetical protein GALMADRAFT_251524 [Galerina marginata CBS 339.88]
MTTTEAPESSEPNALALHASQDSKITNINLYSGRAEITRQFSLQIQAGQNKITIVGLPRTFLEDSLRVEGHGNAAIHEVTTSRLLTGAPNPTVNHDQLMDRKKKELNRDLGRARQSLEVLQSYMHTITAKELDIGKLEATLDSYRILTRKADHEILELEDELAELNRKIDEKKYVTSGPSWQAAINIHGQTDEEVKIYVQYAVHSADWTASYDIRVNTQVKEKATTIVYKAIITQSTGESWNDVPLTLETAAPSLGISPPELLPWRVRPRQLQPEVHQKRSRSRSRSPTRVRLRRRYSPESPRYSPNSPTFSPMERQVTSVSTKGNIVATFRVPGLISVPSDRSKHNITIAELNLDANIIWYTIPVSDPGVHIKAKIKNDSDYTFIPGVANIYVDGSFMGTTNIPSTSPQGLVDCGLGLDSSVRVTYYPREEKSSVAGFYQKKVTQSFTQRITILNTKSTAIENLRVIEHVPISEDESVEVKLHKPPLTMPLSGAQITGVASLLNRVHEKGTENVTAEWAGVDEEGVDQAALGRDGKFNWLVSIPPQKSVALVAQYDVNYPEGIAIQGL